MGDDVGHEGGVFIDRTSAFIKEISVSSLHTCHYVRRNPQQDTMRSQQSATQRRVLSRTGPNWHPDLGLSASRTVRNKFFVVCKPHSLWCFVISSLND